MGHQAAGSLLFWSCRARDIHNKPTVSATVTEGATVAVMQQRILYLLEQYQLGQEGAAGTEKGGTAHKVRQHPWRAFWQAGCVHLLQEILDLALSLPLSSSCPATDACTQTASVSPLLSTSTAAALQEPKLPLPAPQPAGEAASDTADQQRTAEPGGQDDGRDAGIEGADAAASAGIEGVGLGSAGSEGPAQQLAASQPESAQHEAAVSSGGSGLPTPGVPRPELSQPAYCRAAHAC